MTPTRRNVLLFAGGAAAGTALSPAPWRLITDAALWSENWPGVPAPPRGEIRTRFTNCSLCRAGCAVRARSVGDQPVQLAGVTAHPQSRGALCPFGIAAHHLPFHPARLREGSVDAARVAISGRVGVLDLRPGRTASWTYRRAMAAMNGIYIAHEPPVAYDLHKARTVLSLGVPLLEGWGTPGNVWAARPNFHLIQAEPMQSRTAALADEWLRIEPGTEEEVVARLASRLEAEGPALVLGHAGSSEETVFAHSEAPVPAAWQNAAALVTRLEQVEDGSLDTLLIDESATDTYLPWYTIAPKLKPNAVVVTFTASRGGYARHARFALPVAVFPEAAEDIPTAIDSPEATFRISTPLAAPPPGMVDPAGFVADLAGLPKSDTLRERADAIHQSGRGTVFTPADGKSLELKSFTADAFWKALTDSATWIDEPGRRKRLPYLSEPTPRPSNVLFSPATPALLSPLMTKLYQESNLQLAPNRVAVNPADAPAGTRGLLQTELGKCAVEITTDPAVPPGAILVGSAPGILDICGPAARAKVVAL